MKRIIVCLCLFIFIRTEAQQINPVPDYVFSNKMSVGRNAVTDTAAYFSIGPRYGAIRGMMPPMVTDTASMSATKRNGLLIFSIQKNKYVYWDSVGAKWAEMAGTAGSAITGSGVAGYMPEFTTSTNLDTTRLYHSAGRFGIGTTSPSSFFDVIGTKANIAGEQEGIRVIGSIGARQGISFGYDSTSADQYGIIASHTGSERTTINYLAEKHKFTYGQVETAALYIDSLGNVGVRNTSPTYIFDVSGTMRSTGNTFLGTGSSKTYINTTSDVGSYTLQVNGNIYTSSGAVLAASGGNVGIGTTNPAAILHTITPSNSNIGFILDGTGATGTRLEIRKSNTTNTYFGDGGNIFGSGYDASTGLTTGGANFMAFGTNLSERMRIKSDGEVLIGTTTDAGAYSLQVSGAIYNTTTITTGAPSGGTAKPFKIGAAATVSPTSPNRTIEIEIDGTTYYLHAKTTND